jgi:hypothetical protein
VLLIHIDKHPVAITNPKISLSKLAPVRKMIESAIRLCKSHLSIAIANMNPPKNKKMIGSLYPAPAFLSGKTPIIGKNTKGSKAVTAKGKASVTHQTAISKVIASVYWAIAGIWVGMINPTSTKSNIPSIKPILSLCIFLGFGCKGLFGQSFSVSDTAFSWARGTSSHHSYQVFMMENLSPTDLVIKYKILFSQPFPSAWQVDIDHPDYNRYAPTHHGDTGQFVLSVTQPSDRLFFCSFTMNEADGLGTVWVKLSPANAPQDSLTVRFQFRGIYEVGVLPILEYQTLPIIYPNPAQNMIWIQPKPNQTDQAPILYDAQGNPLPTSSQDWGEKIGVNIAQLPAGTYFLRVHNQTQKVEICR